MGDQTVAVDVWTDPRTRSRSLEEAWQRFLAGYRPTGVVRDAIVASWERCRQKGVHPVRTAAPVALSQREAEATLREHALYPVVTPWLARLRDLAAESGHLVVFADAQGTLLQVQGDARVLRKAADMNFFVGAVWREDTAGTNAVGTALATGGAVQVFSAEHFCQAVHPWTCSAAPVRDPATGSVLGVVDLTGFREFVHPHTLSAVIATAHGVEGELAARLQAERVRLTEVYVREVGTGASRGVAVVDRAGAVVGATPDLHEEGWIGRDGRMKGLPPEAVAGTGEVEWDGEGHRGTVRFTLSRVWGEGGTPIGAVVRVVAPRRRHASGRATHPTFPDIVGHSQALAHVIRQARMAAGCDFPVLLQGETGTGKELVAHAIHAASRRSAGPFVAVNCGAIPRELLAAELFGYVAGAFTGASREGRPGKFEAADGGTIFLDEVGEMPPDAQVYLLRVLDGGEVVRLGAHAPTRVDARVIAATNADLEAAVQRGTFRLDLYYRLCILPIHIPPLRDRPEDVEALFVHFLHRACRELGRPVLALSADAATLLRNHPWPGNVRELRNVAYQTALASPGPTVTPDDLPGAFRRTVGDAYGDPPARSKSPYRDLQDNLMRWALAEAGGNVTAAARRLGIHRSTIYRRLNRSG